MNKMFEDLGDKDTALVLNLHTEFATKYGSKIDRTLFNKVGIKPDW